MYSNLALYYLNQIGITPWIRDNNLKHEVIVPKKDSMNVKLLVLTSTELSLKERTLLSHIMTFLGLPNEDTVHLSINERSMEYSAAVTLSFSGTVKSDPQITYLDSLANLIANPLNKKKIFQQLLPLKIQLTAL